MDDKMKRAFDTLFAEMSVLNRAVHALFVTHPDPQALRAELEKHVIHSLNRPSRKDLHPEAEKLSRSTMQALLNLLDVVKH